MERLYSADFDLSKAKRLLSRMNNGVLNGIWENLASGPIQNIEHKQAIQQRVYTLSLLLTACEGVYTQQDLNFMADKAFRTGNLTQDNVDEMNEWFTSVAGSVISIIKSLIKHK